jgi:flagellar biosynthetic protein FlhB
MQERSMLERTEPATPRRREELREKGRVPKSKEIVSFLILAVGFWAIFGFAGRIQAGFMGAFELAASNALLGDLSIDSALSVLLKAMLYFGWTLTPFLILLPIVGLLGYTLQGAVVLSSTPIEPDISRLSPLKGLSRIFSFQGLAELLKALIKLVIIGTIAFLCMKAKLDDILTIPLYGLSHGLELLKGLSYWMLLPLLTAVFFMAVLDTLFQFWDYDRNIRMTRQELKEEAKEREGDPLVRARVRRMMRELARFRMIEQVKTADVVITNPDHVAVALAYDKGQMKAPKLVAKGKGYIALRIAETAREHRIEVVQDPPLARTLFKAVNLDAEIPPKLYQAVAKILAFVYAKGQKRTDGLSG